MADEKPSTGMYKYGFVILLVIVIILAALLVGNSLKQSAIQRNKEIAVQIIHQGLETGDDPYIDLYFDPDIQLVFPPAFHMPNPHASSLSGLENVKKAIRAWKADTMHQAEILDVVADEDTVAVLISYNRIFRMGNDTVTYKNNPTMYFVTFRNGKIIKIEGVFDVLNDVEAYKDSKLVTNQSAG